MARPIARIHGTAVRPGVSRNRRYYSAAMIAEAVKAAQARLAEGIRPMTMLTHHGADNDGDSTRIVGRLADIQLQEDGSATYTAEIAGTQHGRDILELIDTHGTDPPFLRGVSFRGDWIGQPQRIVVDGDVAVTADGFEMDGIDFTYRPGIDGAGVDAVERIDEDDITETRESAPLRSRIYESVQEARVTTTTFTEEAATAPAAATTTAASIQYADNGYLAGEKRYPLDTAANTRAAHRAIAESTTARQYTAAQLKRMRQRVGRALREHHTEVADSGYLITRQPLTEAVAEMYGFDYLDTPSGHVYLTLDNGLVTISISSCRIDPHDLDRVARAAMEGACQALLVIDPDMDGDADPAESARNSRLAETAPDSAGLTEADVPAPQGADHAQHEEEEPAVSEPTNPAVATTPAAPTQPDPAATTPVPTAGSVTLSTEQFEAMLNRIAGTAPAKVEPELVGAGAPAESAPPGPAPVAEVAPAQAAVVESEDAKIARLIREAQTTLIQDLTQQGILSPGRRGFVAGTVTESAPAAAGTYPARWPTKDGVNPKAPHELTPDEFDKHVSQGITMPAVIGNRT